MYVKLTFTRALTSKKSRELWVKQNRVECTKERERKSDRGGGEGKKRILSENSWKTRILPFRSRGAMVQGEKSVLHLT